MLQYGMSHVIFVSYFVILLILFTYFVSFIPHNHLSSFSCRSYQFLYSHPSLQTFWASSSKAPDQTQEHVSGGIAYIYNTFFFLSSKRAIKRSVNTVFHSWKKTYIVPVIMYQLNYTTREHQGLYAYLLNMLAIFKQCCNILNIWINNIFLIFFLLTLHIILKKNAFLEFNYHVNENRTKRAQLRPPTPMMHCELS